MIRRKERLQRVTKAARADKIEGGPSTALAQFGFEQTRIVSISISEQDFLFAGRMQIAPQPEPDIEKNHAATLEQTRIVPLTILEQDFLFAGKMSVAPHRGRASSYVKGPRGCMP